MCEDDMLVNSQKTIQNEEHLEEVIGINRELMLNPAKCTFGVKAGKFLGYIVTEKRVEVNQAKVSAQ